MRPLKSRYDCRPTAPIRVRNVGSNETLTAMTFRMSPTLHEELMRTARRRGVSAAKIVREAVASAVLGTRSMAADKMSLSTVIWISEYLMAATKRDKEEVARLWEVAESKADAILG